MAEHLRALLASPSFERFAFPREEVAKVAVTIAS
jgi:hypothetical protein